MIYDKETELPRAIQGTQHAKSTSSQNKKSTQDEKALQFILTRRDTAAWSCCTRNRFRSIVATNWPRTPLIPTIIKGIAAPHGVSGISKRERMIDLEKSVFPYD